MNFIRNWILGLGMFIGIVVCMALLSSKSPAQSKIEPAMPTITLIRNERTSWGKQFVIDDPSSNMRCISVINDSQTGGGAAVTCYARSYGR